MNPGSVPSSPEQGPAQPSPEARTETIDPVERVEYMAPAAQETIAQSREAANQNQGMMMLPQVTQDDTGSQQPPAQQPIEPPSQSQQHTDSPAVADDVDVIEKEWVNKAKTIIHETRDDPHRQEKEVSKLQSDYLKKRYGKIIKPSGD